jgi:hypothetical protein
LVWAMGAESPSTAAMASATNMIICFFSFALPF